MQCACVYTHFGWLTRCSNAFLIILDVYKAKVAESEVYITELLEKTQAEEQKQIITGSCIITIHDIR